jgi:TPR repeat protein
MSISAENKNATSVIHAGNASGGTVTNSIGQLTPELDSALRFEWATLPGQSEIAWRFGLAALVVGDGRSVYREDPVCSEDEHANAAMKAENYQEAARLFEPLAARGSAWAHANLGWMHMNGHLGPPDVAKGIAAFEKAAVPGYPEAKYFLGSALLKAGDRRRAEIAFREGAAENNERCTSELMHLEETRAWEALKAEKYQEAALLYEPLVARGSLDALINLGWMFNRGHLGAPDPQKAMSLWEQAARMGSVDAKFRIARTLIANGESLRARALFLEGAELSHKPCMYWAGRMEVRGQGGPTNHEAGVALLKRAADSGHVYARRDLLRLELTDAGSVLERLRVRAKLLSFALATFRRAVREPDFCHSDDIR